MNEIFRLIEQKNNALAKEKIIFDRTVINTARTRYGNTLLIYSAYFGNEEMVLFLLDNGADRTLFNDKGETAEKVALDNNKPSILARIRTQESVR